MQGIEITLRKADGLKLARLMYEQKITPYRVRKDIGVQENTLKSILNGDSNYSIDSLNKLKVYLGVITQRDIEEAIEILTKIK